MIYRAFVRSELHPAPARLVGKLHAAGIPIEPHFRGDDLGWTGARLILPGDGTPVQLDRFLTDADELRPDLNRFAAELETLTYSPYHTALMERVIQTRQLFALRRPIDHADELLLDRLCVMVVQYFAQELDGLFQIDGQGWFEADGTLLVQEY